MKEVAATWSKELTDGGRDVMNALKDLGDAGTTALKDLAASGGALTDFALGRLEEMARKVNNVANDVGNRLNNAYQSLPSTRDVLKQLIDF
jgi:hypothetical protein